ncbi:MAG: 3-hydroxyacyl-CoA dehydrogenase NAD-binding domain-containing protein [Kofleriaceae bacterium]
MDQATQIGIIGTGLMGAGIAEVAALAGHPVVLVKATGGDVAPVRGRIERSLAARVAKGKLDAAVAEAALARIEVSTALDAVAACGLVIEAIIEDLAAKRALFAQLDALVADDAILASNTSTLKITDLAAGLRPHRTLGLHFFSPVPAMQLVEIAHLPDTDAEALAACERFVTGLGKTAVPVLDSTGFVVNRLLVPMLLGAIAAYEQRLASAEHIDTAMRLGCGHPLGPLALSDLIGLDVVYAMAKLLYAEFRDDRYRAPALLRRLVQAGHLGKKTGLGLYDYATRPARANAAALVVLTDDALAA